MVADADSQLKLLEKAQNEAQAVLTQVLKCAEEVRQERESVLAYMKENGIMAKKITSKSGWPYERAKKKIEELLSNISMQKRLNKLAGTDSGGE
jgi:superfamily II DNA helicase RecQ